MKEWLVLVGDEHATVATVRCDRVEACGREVQMYRTPEGEIVREQLVAVWSLDNIAGVMQSDPEGLLMLMR